MCATQTLALPSYAQAPSQGPDRVVETEQRLSDWLLANPLPDNADLFALGWYAAAERAGQQQRQTELRQALAGRFSALAGVIADMPVTGRVPLPKADARWLQTNPKADPWLRRGDVVHAAPRSPWVSLLRVSGHMCQVPHQQGADTATYLRACGVVAADRAWVVQPDGRVFSHGVAGWNGQSQDAPAPGAWLWAPDMGEGMDAVLSEQVVAFLATQAVAQQGVPWSYKRQARKVSQADQARDLPLIGNDWGVVGLLQTPTARMAPAGTGALSFSRQEPYSMITMTLQPVDWLEVAFGYISISDRLYGPDIAGDQSYKDKSAHVKVRLLEESRLWPQVAVGWRDLLGTGIFSGEYFVASKRFGAFDLSAGLGFGYVGGRGDVRNPLGLVAKRFDTRPDGSTYVGNGGTVSTHAFFRGPAAFFGGVQYELPGQRWVLKAEIDGNDYANDQAGRPIKQRTPLNLGVVYRPWRWLDVTLGVERGDMPTLTVQMNAPLDKLFMPKVLDARAVPVAAGRPAKAGDPSVTARDIQVQTGLRVSSIEQRGNTWSVVVADPAMGYERPVVDKVAAVVHRDAPAPVDRIELRFDQRGVKVAQAVVDREAWARARTQLLPTSERSEAITKQAVPPASAQASSEVLYDSEPSRFSYGFGLGYRQTLGGPDGLLLFQLSATLDAAFKLSPDTWVSTYLNVGLIDNYDKFKFTASSNLPRVRTYIREYLTTRNATMPNLQLTHMGGAGDHFYLAYAGLLETMYAGIGGEYLYRPVGSRLAVGLDVNRVRQRAFEQDFGLRDYEVSTGHVSAYWDTGWQDVVAKISAGQYLAGDRGVTLDISRVFPNGVTMGAYATKTNVSAEQFGEGSFDKGVYVTIPFDAILLRSGPSTASIVYAPLLRDGGARLGRRFKLYDLTSTRDPRALQFGAP
ncbi:MAG: YjbH domain-containing protein [Aquabacterium sp.]|jgi:hypothetical protein|uniref:YjbH domain-containing protein n=1 Tax=Aquabacterium sp. TaxID=1872578 RepID=UPI003BAF6659